MRMTADPCDDSALVHRIRQGDKTAEEELFLRFKRTVTLIIKATGAAAAVQDLCQETFVIVLRAITRGTLRDPDKLRAFISQVARNVSIEYLRKLDRRQEVDQDWELPDERHDPFRDAAREESVRIVAKALSSLKSRRDRDLLLRFYLEEEAKEQICKDLGMTSQQFNLVLFRARKQFKKLYTDLLTRRSSRS
jgi:RNA polymerase sigma-70 factor (ECF subfamily)